jgi:hypothetical protein
VAAAVEFLRLNRTENSYRDRKDTSVMANQFPNKAEQLLRNLINEFCEKQFDFDLNLKLYGSLHILADNEKMLTCLIDENLTKSAGLRQTDSVDDKNDWLGIRQTEWQKQQAKHKRKRFTPRGLPTMQINGAGQNSITQYEHFDTDDSSDTNGDPVIGNESLTSYSDYNPHAECDDDECVNSKRNVVSENSVCEETQETKSNKKSNSSIHNSSQTACATTSASNQKNTTINGSVTLTHLPNMASHQHLIYNRYFDEFNLNAAAVASNDLLYKQQLQYLAQNLLSYKNLQNQQQHQQQQQLHAVVAQQQSASKTQQLDINKCMTNFANQ